MLGDGNRPAGSEPWVLQNFGGTAGYLEQPAGSAGFAVALPEVWALEDRDDQPGMLGPRVDTLGDRVVITGRNFGSLDASLAPSPGGRLAQWGCGSGIHVRVVGRFGAGGAPFTAACSTVVWRSDSELQCDTPPGLGSGHDVEVEICGQATNAS